MRQPAALLPCLVCAASAAFGETTPVAPSGETPPPTHAPPLLSAADCLERLDAAVLIARDGDERRAERVLRRLERRCEHLPQIRHDLGVLAARDDRLPEAMAHFEASLAADPRAAMTRGHLRELHRREARRAYARVLDAVPPATGRELVLQDSADVNADSLRASRSRGELRDFATLEYELYDWWASATDPDADGWLAHYVDGYPRRLALASREAAAALAWEEVRRELAFTAEEAVAVLDAGAGGDGAGEDGARRLLLLRLDGNRWKIYRETPL